jgi:hypothetical protein
MSWWDRLRRTAAEDWHWEHLPSERVPTDGERTTVAPSTAYLSAHLVSMHLTDKRVGSKTLYGSVTSVMSLETRGAGRAEFVTVTTPEALRNVDAGHLDRVVVTGTRLLGPVPYRSGDLTVEIGLFAVPASDLLGPYLTLVEQVSGLAGVTVAPVTATVLPIVKSALDAVFGAADGPVLEVGLSFGLREPATGYYCVVRAPRGDPSLSGLRVEPDGRLAGADGVPVTAPYLVFRISAAPHRDDWARIPELLAGWERIRDAARQDDLSRAQAELTVFERCAILSPDLLAADGRRIAEVVRAEVGLAFPATATSGTPSPVDVLPEFEDLPVTFDD